MYVLTYISFTASLLCQNVRGGGGGGGGSSAFRGGEELREASPMPPPPPPLITTIHDESNISLPAVSTVAYLLNSSLASSF